MLGEEEPKPLGAEGPPNALPTPLANPILVVAHKEWLELTRDRRFVFSTILVYLLLIGCLLTAWQRYQTVELQYGQAQATMRKLWDEQGPKNPHEAAHQGMYVFKPQTALSLLEPGVDRFTGIAVALEAHRQSQFRYRPAQDLGAHALGELSAVNVALGLLPLLIIVVGASMIAGERESGRLRMLLSSGISARDLAWGKSYALGGAMLTVLLPACVVMVAAVGISVGPDRAWAALPRVAILVVVLVAYLAGWVGLTLGVSARAGTTRRAFATLLAVWLITVEIVPRASADAASTLVRARSTGEFEERVRQDLEETGLDGKRPAQRVAACREGMLRKYGVSTVQELPFNYSGALLRETEAYGNLVFDKRFSELWQSYAEQERVQMAGAVASPYVAARAISMSLAGTGLGAFRDFASAAERYRRDFIGRLNEELVRNAPPGTAASEYIRDNDLWRSIPRFRYELVGLGEQLRRSWIAFAMLALYCGAALIFCRRGFERLRP